MTVASKKKRPIKEARLTGALASEDWRRKNVLRRLTAGFDFGQIGGVLSQAQIVVCLQVHPELRRQSEVLPQ